MTSFRDIPHSATKEGVRLAVPAAVSDSSHVLLCVGVPTVTVGNKKIASNQNDTHDNQASCAKQCKKRFQNNDMEQSVLERLIAVLSV